jgi:magnesium transporter
VEIKAVDFNTLLIDEKGQADFALANSFNGKKSFVKQLSGKTFFVSLQDKHHLLKVLINHEQFLIHEDQKLVKKIEKWLDKQLVETPYDVLCLIGFDSLERAEKQLETVEAAMEALEERILEGPKKSQQTQILHLHREAIHQKKHLNEYLAVFIRCKQNTPLWDELILRTQSTLDNARQLVELMENLREAYQASVDNKLNDIMKLLTVLATILLPINLLTSFFGMNFEHMPLIHSNTGIYLLYLVSGLFIICSVTYFKRKDWL